MKLGSLKRVPLREVWKNEARDFSKWLATKEGISLLGEAVGFEIEPTETESAVGRYSVDILAKVSGTDQTVVIENQIEDSNHDHLGKLITYAAGKGASCAIWIVKKANDEHRRAVEFLNETSRSTIGYFLLEIEAWKIGESEPAPKFNIVESPNDWARSMIPDSEGTEVTQLYLRYWTWQNQVPCKVVSAERYHWYSNSCSTFLYIPSKSLAQQPHVLQVHKPFPYRGNDATLYHIAEGEVQP